MIETNNLWWLVIVLSVFAALCFSMGIDAKTLKMEGISIKPYMLAGGIAATIALGVALGSV